jgi:SEC-C motif-containing protein
MSEQPQTNRCPCGSDNALPACCGRYLSRAEFPTTAEELMRSRYTAYVVGDVEYIMDSHDTATSEAVDRASAARWARQAEWLGLEVLDTERGQPTDDDGIVEFKARYRLDGAVCTHHERSTFRKTRGRWFYVEGEAGKPMPGARTPKIGRNEPCPCGSGKKHKKCCGK